MNFSRRGIWDILNWSAVALLPAKDTTTRRRINAMTKKVYWIHIFIPLIFGAMIYALFSPEAYFVTMLRQIFHVPPWSISIRSSFGNMIVGILRNYGCDMLWVYSLIYAVHFYSRHTAIPLWGVFIIGSGMGIMIEILQAFSLISNTEAE
jgi:hypothetical protein